jgi:hypothetical protein
MLDMNRLAPFLVIYPPTNDEDSKNSNANSRVSKDKMFDLFEKSSKEIQQQNYSNNLFPIKFGV